MGIPYEIWFFIVGIVINIFLILVIDKKIYGKRDNANKNILKRKNGSAHPKLVATSPILKTSPNDDISIFLSYRRDDSADVTGRIYDRLARIYGSEKVFKDVDSIPLGEDFREYIDLMVAKSTVFLVVIGPKWKGNKDGDAYKIDDPRDFVRLEVASALKRKIPVIPLLVANAKIPSEHDLPKDIRSLAFRNGIPLRPDPDFNNDIERLFSGLSKLSNKIIKLTQNPLLL